MLLLSRWGFILDWRYGTCKILHRFWIDHWSVFKFLSIVKLVFSNLISFDFLLWTLFLLEQILKFLLRRDWFLLGIPLWWFSSRSTWVDSSVWRLTTKHFAALCWLSFQTTLDWSSRVLFCLSWFYWRSITFLSNQSL